MSEPTLGYRKPPPHERRFLGHPFGLYLLFLVEMWERFSYYGMRGLLILYLTQKTDVWNPGRGFSDEVAGNMYGWYTGMAYFLPIFGGIIADKLIGTHRSLLVGATVIALGHIVLGVSGMGALAHNDAGMAIFVAGLALIVIGTGHFKPNVSVMVGDLYPPGDPRRDGAFTIFYMGINLGAFICAFICGTLGQKVGWHWGFGSAAVGMLAGLILYVTCRPIFLPGIGEPPSGAAANMWTPFFFVAALVLSAAVGLGTYTKAFASASTWFDTVTAAGTTGAVIYNILWWSIVAGMIVLLVGFLAKLNWWERGPVLCIFVFIFFNAVFWLAFEQAGSSLNLFAERSTDRMIGSFEVPATWFQSVGSLLIIFLAPLFAGMWSALDRRGLNPGQPMKLALALILLGLGYVCMVVGSLGTSQSPAGATNPAASVAKASMIWLFLTYFLHTVGELFMSPTGLSFLTKTAPVRFVSFLMGLWFLSNSLANKIGGTIAGQITNVEQGKVKLPWNFGGQADFFFLFVVSSIGAGIIVLALVPLLNWLLKDRRPPTAEGFPVEPAAPTEIRTH